MRTVLLVGSLFFAPVLPRILTFWVVVPTAKLFRGWSAALVPLAALLYAAWCFRPPTAADTLYWCVYVWWVLCWFAEAAMTTFALVGVIADAKNRSE